MPARVDKDPQHLAREATANSLLAAMPIHARTRLLANAELRTMRVRELLFDIDKPIPFIYFPLRGVVSIVSAIFSGEAVETGTVGPEGMVGVPVFLGATQVSTQAFWQVAGSAIVVPADHFRNVIESEVEARNILGKYVVAFLSQTEQTSACNRLHNIRQRCARWLLQTHDRVGERDFGLAHEYLAQMLGVRRATVSVVAGELQREGLIEYTYRQITVLNRAGLEAAACECYRIIRAEFARLVGGETVPSLFASVETNSEGNTALATPSVATSPDDLSTATANEEDAQNSS